MGPTGSKQSPSSSSSASSSSTKPSPSPTSTSFSSAVSAPSPWDLSSPISTKSITFKNLDKEETAKLLKGQQSGTYITEFVESLEGLSVRFNFVSPSQEVLSTELYKVEDSSKPLTHELIMVALLEVNSKNCRFPLTTSIGNVLNLFGEEEDEKGNKVSSLDYSPLEFPPLRFDSTTKKWIPLPSSPPSLPPSTPPSLSFPPIKLYTQNLWFDDFYKKERIRAVLKFVEKEDPDIVCFQEVTSLTLSYISSNEFIRSKYFLTASDLSDLKGVDSHYFTMMLVKSTLGLKRFLSFHFPSNQGRTLLVADIEVTKGDKKEKFAVGTVHLESHRPSGRFRAIQLKLTFPFIKSLAPTSILCGDFNFCSTWALDNSFLDSSYIDLWPHLHSISSQNGDAGGMGWSEDTRRNAMLYMKEGRREKQVRYDRVLLRSDDLEPEAIELVGTEPLPFPEAVHFSDHFGLLASFSSKK